MRRRVVQGGQKGIVGAQPRLWRCYQFCSGTPHRQRSQHLSSVTGSTNKTPQRKIPIRFYFDYRSPFSYLAKDPAYKIQEDYKDVVTMEWLPFAFFVKEGFGLVETRDRWQWNKVKYAYVDARRWANSRNPPLVLYGPKKVFDPNLALMGGLYAQKKGMSVFYKYTDVVFEQFWQRKLDIEDFGQVVAVLDQAATVTGHAEGKEEWLKGFQQYVRKGSEGGQEGERGQGWKELERIRAQGEEEGVFGVPMFVVDGELFFGNDRVDWVRKKLDDIIHKPCL
jgi:2-hydroxychromene-2-carboxylate isomerase